MTTTVTVGASNKRVLVETFADTNGTTEGMKCLTSVVLPPSNDSHQFNISGNATISISEATDDQQARDLTEKGTNGGPADTPAVGTVNQIGDSAPAMPAMPEPGSADDKADMGNLDAGTSDAQTQATEGAK